MQIEAIAKGFPEPQKRMCDACAAQFEELQDQELPCRIRGCKRTWLWTTFMQLESRLSGETAAAGRMCPECFDLFKTFEDRELPCRVPGCAGSWKWTRGMQLEAARKGNARPPRRLCDKCTEAIEGYSEKPMPCRNPGCASGWSWSPESQLSHARRGRGNEPPRRICAECKAFLEKAETGTLSCLRCQAPIVWTREHQLNVKLGAWVRPTLCADCHRLESSEAARKNPKKTPRPEA